MAHHLTGATMTSRRHVPIITGVVCFALVGFFIFKWPGPGFWSFLLSLPFFIYGWYAIRFGFSASDKEVQEMTDPDLSRKPSNDTLDKFDDYL